MLTPPLWQDQYGAEIVNVGSRRSRFNEIAQGFEEPLAIVAFQHRRAIETESGGPFQGIGGEDRACRGPPAIDAVSVAG